MNGKVIFAALAAASTLCACQSSKVRISGRIVGNEARNIYLEQVTPLSERIIDSAQLDKEGNYRFEVREAAATPSLYNVVYDGERIPLLLAAGDRLTLSSVGSVARNYTVEGSAESELLRQFYQSYVAGVQRLDDIAQQVAQQVAEALGIDQVYSQLLPGDKVKRVEELLERPAPSGKVAFVGDGINDAPVLARADVGIAMGAMGSDAAIEAADVVLMDDDLRKVATAIRASRKCLGIVRQNIALAIGVKVLCLVLVALGWADMWLAIFADVGVMVLAVLNAIRALRVE